MNDVRQVLDPVALVPAVIFGPAHLVVLTMVVVGTPLLCWRARRDPGARWLLGVRRGLSLLLILNQVVWQVERLATDRWTPEEALPCHLCDAALFAAAWALWRPDALAFELGYFWGLAGTLQGLITPNIPEDFPDYEFFRFFVMHAGIPVGMVFLAAGLGMRPRRGAVLRMVLWTNAMAAVAAVINLVSGGNYMFLREPPPSGSLLDLLGPWPWYILVAEGFALVMFLLLALPFGFRTRTTEPR